MQDQDVSLGEYIRRLRRAADLSLYALAEETKISYSHLSRIESDSTIPSADSVAKIAEALNGDLKLMLEKAQCLPRFILDRIDARGAVAQGTSLKRAALGSTDRSPRSPRQVQALVDRAIGTGLDEDVARDLAEAFELLIGLAPSKIAAITQLIRSLDGEEDAPG
jgi:transcriptional regulator with XRE-family HTH domain